MESYKIEKNLNTIEYGVRKMIDRYLFLSNKINKLNSYNKESHIERIKLIEERKLLEDYLRFLDIQPSKIKDDLVAFYLIK